ncbi:MAG: hypothetical protein ACOC6P_02175, partial [Candidatus Aminicenantaceae bacterium]
QAPDRIKRRKESQSHPPEGGRRHHHPGRNLFPFLGKKRGMNNGKNNFTEKNYENFAPDRMFSVGLYYSAGKKRYPIPAAKMPLRC